VGVCADAISENGRTPRVVTKRATGPTCRLINDVSDAQSFFNALRIQDEASIASATFCLVGANSEKCDLIALLFFLIQKSASRFSTFVVHQ
jgi:hypothetical protein